MLYSNQQPFSIHTRETGVNKTVVTCINLNFKLQDIINNDLTVTLIKDFFFDYVQYLPMHFKKKEALFQVMCQKNYSVSLCNAEYLLKKMMKKIIHMQVICRNTV